MFGLKNRLVESVKNWLERRKMEEGYAHYLKVEYRDIFRPDNRSDHNAIARYMFNEFMKN